MTVVISVKVDDGIVLASDSAIPLEFVDPNTHIQ
jgi:20S proteasome alpha/beta subunit